MMKLKLVFLSAAVVLVALGVWTTAATTASGPEFHCTGSTPSCLVVGQSTSTNEFNFGSSGVECEAKFSGTIAKATATAILEPSYSGCKTVGMTFSSASNGCTYRLKVASPSQANMDILCPSGQAITLKELAIGCTTKIGAQSLSTVLLSNTGGTEPTEEGLEFKLTGVTYTSTCFGGGTFSNGQIKGTARIAGYEDKEGVKGAKVGLHVF